MTYLVELGTEMVGFRGFAAAKLHMFNQEMKTRSKQTN